MTAFPMQRPRPRLLHPGYSIVALTLALYIRFDRRIAYQRTRLNVLKADGKDNYLTGTRIPRRVGVRVARRLETY